MIYDEGKWLREDYSALQDCQHYNEDNFYVLCK